MDSTIQNVTSSPTPGVPVTFVVVWEWENHQKRWRPYSPDVTQLLERAHQKNLNRIYLKDADPILEDFHVDMNKFTQVCEPSGETFPVRREFYSYTSPAGKGAKWEWRRDDLSSEWHVYDMEVQTIVEEAWTVGNQTVDISLYFPGCPYIMNFCNMTQVRKNSGVVRPIRRTTQASYPIVKLTPNEIATIMNRRKERCRMLREIDSQREINKPNKKLSGKKSVKHLFSHFLHQRNYHAERISKDEYDSSIKRKAAVSVPHINHQLMPENGVHSRPFSGFMSSQKNETGSRLSQASWEGGNHNHQEGSEFENQTMIHRGFHDYSSFSSVSETASMTRRPSMDTISTYLSHESMMKQNYGFFTRSLSMSESYHGSDGLIFQGNQNEELENYTKSITAFQPRIPTSSMVDSSIGCIAPFTEEKMSGCPRTRERNLIELDPIQRALANSHSNHISPSSLCALPAYVRNNSKGGSKDTYGVPSGQKERANIDERQNTIVNNTSRVSSPKIMDLSSNIPIRNGNVNIQNDFSFGSSNSHVLTSLTKKRPVPSPRTMVNSSCSSNYSFLNYSDATEEFDSPLERLIFHHAHIVDGFMDAGDHCPICNAHHNNAVAEGLQSAQDNQKKIVVRFLKCQHNCHFECLKEDLCRKQHQQTNFHEAEKYHWPTIIQCPKCKIVCGVMKGTMPSNGSTMSFKVIPKGLPGYEDYHSIQITYNIQSGIQGDDCPHPGEPYLSIGFPRTAFLPDTEVGRKVLRLLETAFQQRLTFMINPGGPAEAADVVVWNDAITHKVEFGPSVDSGFPDPNYLDLVLAQLQNLGLDAIG